MSRLQCLWFEFDSNIYGEKHAIRMYSQELNLFVVAFVQRHLGKLMGTTSRRKGLLHDAMLLHYTDMAMLREGIESLSDFELERVSLLINTLLIWGGGGTS